VTLNPNLFGENLPQGSETEDIRRLIEKYPAILANRGLLYWYMLKERCPFLAQLPENQRNEIKHFCGSIENIRRRSQDYKSSIPQ
jgi:hypothetical protein